MASSPEKPHHHLLLPTPLGATAAPPPTPSAQPNLSSESSATDFLSNLLHRLPPTLSLSVPARRSSPLSFPTASSSAPTNITAPPVISPCDHSALLSASTKLGFFRLADQPIPSHVPVAAECAALALFNLPHQRKQLLFPYNWPLGHEIDDEDEGSSATESFCVDSSLSADSTDELDLGPLREFTREMEELGLNVLEELASAVGFSSPARDELCSQLWISVGANKPGRVYPYALALQYQTRCHMQSLLSDSGWVSVSGHADSVFVTLGDIAQMAICISCINVAGLEQRQGQKVRGRAFPITSDESIVTMSLLITLPVESTVCPLVPDSANDNCNGEKRKFNRFSFEDYAWRLYHERLFLKDPLVRYRV